MARKDELRDFIMATSAVLGLALDALRDDDVEVAEQQVIAARGLLAELSKGQKKSSS